MEHIEDSQQQQHLSDITFGKDNHCGVGGDNVGATADSDQYLEMMDEAAILDRSKFLHFFFRSFVIL